MNTLHAFPLIALAASIVLVLQLKGRPLPWVVLATSGIEVLRAFRILHIDIRGVPLNLLLGGVLLVVAVLLYFQVTAKPGVAAATCVALIGLLQVLTSVRGF